MRHRWLALLAAAGVGCSGMPKLPAARDLPGMPAATATAVMASAEAKHLEKDGVPFHQGMVCRAYFFAGKNEIPVKVRGDVTVTVHELGPDGEPAKAPRVFSYPADRLDGTYRKDIVGHSYLFWLDYEPPARCKLRVVAALRQPGQETIAAKPVEVDLLPLKQQLALARKKNLPVIGQNFEVVSTSSAALGPTKVADMPLWADGHRPMGVMAAPQLLAPRTDAAVRPAAAFQPGEPPPVPTRNAAANSP